jgi:hypothetical protein
VPLRVRLYSLRSRSPQGGGLRPPGYDPSRGAYNQPPVSVLRHRLIVSVAHQTIRLKSNGWSSGLTMGRYRGTDTSTVGRLYKDCAARQSLYKRNSGAPTKNRLGYILSKEAFLLFVRVSYFIFILLIVLFLLHYIGGYGITNTRLLTTANKTPPLVLKHRTGADQKQMELASCPRLPITSPPPTLHARPAKHPLTMPRPCGGKLRHRRSAPSSPLKPPCAFALAPGRWLPSSGRSVCPMSIMPPSVTRPKNKLPAPQRA